MKTEINEKEFISQLKSKNNEYDRLSFLITMLDWKMDLGNRKFVQIISLRNDAYGHESQWVLGFFDDDSEYGMIEIDEKDIKNTGTEEICLEAFKNGELHLGERKLILE